VPVTRDSRTIVANDSIAEVVLLKQGTFRGSYFEICGVDAFNFSVDEEFMDITWHISFSSRSPAKMSIADGIGILGASRIGYNQSDYQRVIAQDKAELWSTLRMFLLFLSSTDHHADGIVGHRFHDDSHPRRRVGLGTSV
jgi:hypothetical protein